MSLSARAHGTVLSTTQSAPVVTMDPTAPEQVWALLAPQQRRVVLQTIVRVGRQLLQSQKADLEVSDDSP